MYMKELLYTVAAGLVADPASISMGRVIGKQGRIAKAIRTIMRAGAARENLKVAVEID